MTTLTFDPGPIEFDTPSHRAAIPGYLMDEDGTQHITVAADNLIIRPQLLTLEQFGLSGRDLDDSVYVNAADLLKNLYQNPEQLKGQLFVEWKGIPDLQKIQEGLYRSRYLVHIDFEDGRKHGTQVFVSKARLQARD